MTKAAFTGSAWGVVDISTTLPAVKRASLYLLAAVGLFTGCPAAGYTDCPATQVSKVLAVDAGSVAIWFTSGMIGYHAVSGGSAQTILALATTASVAGRSVSPRFAADGVDCSIGGFRSDLVGLYFNSN